MQKFSEIRYARPDIVAYKRALEEYAEKLKNAESWDAFKALWLEKTELAKEIMTMRSVASIRNTVNTADAFYDGEMRYFNAEMPAASLCERKLERVLLESRFVSDFEREFGSILIATMRNSARFADERIIPFQVRIGDLVRRYVVCSSSASTEFRGEKCNFYGLLKAMQSPDRALRREAFEAWSALYASIAPELDQIYDEMIAARSEMAETLGFKSYTDMAYLERRRFDYTPADVKEFRDGVKKVITPACARLFEKQRELEREYMPWRDYDESEFLSGGGFWMQKQHIFLYPFYYIEYALAQMCAFQFYLRMEENRAAAWADYLNLCRAGGSRGYFDLLKLAKLDNPFNAETVEAITNAVVRKIDEMEKKL